MRKFLFSILLLVLPLIANAETVQIDGIWYQLIEKAKQAQVMSSTNGTKYTGNMVIPKKVEYNKTEYNVTSIGNNAFNGCSNLTNITIPNSVTSIGNNAFEGCKDLTDVYCYAEKVPIIEENSFENSYIEYAILHVPELVINDYKTTVPWSNFGTIKSLTDETPVVQKCVIPTINYSGGKLTFACETENVDFVSDISCEDIKKHYENEISLSKTYIVSVYSTKTGYENSETATAIICWIECDHKSDAHGMEVIPATVVLIKASNGIITIEGLETDTPVAVYTTSGAEVANGVAEEATLTLETNLQKGDIAIVKMGTKSVKVVMK